MGMEGSTTWEVRTTGHADNGGGFSSYYSGGIDRSQSDTPYITFDGSTIHGATAGVAALITITGHTVAAADKGNVVKITGGTNFTTGYFQITNVDTGANTWTVDRNCCSAAASGMTGRMGGAAADMANFAANASTMDYNTVYVKSGTYTGAPVFGDFRDSKIIGYLSTRTDCPTGTDRPLINAAGNTYGIHVNNDYRDHSYFNIRIDGATSHGINTGDYSTSYLYNVKITGCGGYGVRHGLAGDLIEISGCTSGGAAGGGNLGRLVMSRAHIHDNGGKGIDMSHSSTSYVLNKCIFADNDSHGARFYLSNSVISNSLFVNNSGTTDGLYGYRSYSAWMGIIENCIFASNGRYGLNGEDTGELLYSLCNCFYGNGTDGKYKVSFKKTIGEVTTDPKLNAPTSDDFTLQSGSSCIDTGFDFGDYVGATI